MDEQYADATIQLPEQASTLAPQLDSMYYDIYWISVVFFVAIVGAMVWFAFKFRRRPGVTSKPPGHHNALELFWTFSPLILLAYMFHEGFEGFMFMSVPPANSMNVRVTAQQWNWTFTYPNGGTADELTVPEHQPIRLIMGSNDVLHSFFVPVLRVKRDVVPGMFSSLWFEPTRRGTYDIFCTEYCGAPQPREGMTWVPPTAAQLRVDGRPTDRAGHSGMLSRIHIVSRAEFNDFYDRLINIPEEYNGDYHLWGQALFQANCTACHVIEPGAAPTTGPNLTNVAGYPQPLEGGGDHVADLEYIRRSIREPQADVVRGFAPVMTPFPLHELQIDALAAFVASLSDRGDPIRQEVQRLHAEQNE